MYLRNNIWLDSWDFFLNIFNLNLICNSTPADYSRDPRFTWPPFFSKSPSLSLCITQVLWFPKNTISYNSCYILPFRTPYTTLVSSKPFLVYYGSDHPVQCLRKRILTNLLVNSKTKRKRINNKGTILTWGTVKDVTVSIPPTGFRFSVGGILTMVLDKNGSVYRRIMRQ